MQIIYVLVGLPFSGKSTFAHAQLTPDDLLIERDRFLEQTYQDPIAMMHLQTETRVLRTPISRFRSCREQNAFNDALTTTYVRWVTTQIHASQSPKIIVDGTHLHILSRAFVKAFPSAHTVAIILATPLNTCIERLRITTRTGLRNTITEEALRQLTDVFELPSTAEGFHEIRTIKHGTIQQR